jgi:hypothetical protein
MGMTFWNNIDTGNFIVGNMGTLARLLTNFYFL